MTEPYALPDLPYDYGALEPHISAEVMELHHGTHHAGYVKGANTALEQLSEARQKGAFPTITMLEKNLAFHLSGHVNHTVFWQNMSPDGGGRPGGELATAIDASFGSWKAFRGHFTAAATTVQGSGWAVLAYHPIGQRLLIEQLHDHQGNRATGSVPLLMLDVWEHAYYLQYRSAKGDYVDAFSNVIDWEDVGRRLSAARDGVPQP